MNVLTAIREHMFSSAGHVARMDYKEICAKALRCRGLQWWRWRQLHWKEVEKDKWAGPGLQVCWKCRCCIGNCPGQYGLVASCSKPWKLEASLEMWKGPCIDDPGCLGEKIWERVVWRAPGTPLDTKFLKNELMG